ncbi:uncharacterized protein LOC128132889 [Lactuca sativa]|uniref:uncharacterized protein LOC128132889 n=1 Tax=Lactuca sativa TaxID=4236 RepID=UPI0022AE5F13|nr:uncharacterized protein LOC128132889 [Lactuca sativa]
MWVEIFILMREILQYPLVRRDFFNKLTGVIRQTLEQHKRDSDKGKEKATRESSREKAKRPSFKTFKSNGATEFSDKANYASAMLIGEALVWWEATFEALNEYDQENLSWEMFKIRFLGKYCSLDMRRRLEKEFLELKQGGMTVTEYETQFNQRARFAAKYIPTEDDKSQLFMEGLRYEIRDFVINRDILSFDKAVEYVRKREHDLEIRGATLSVPKHLRVDRTVSVSTIPSAQSDPSTKVQSQSAFRGRSRPQSFSLQSRAPPPCQKCGKSHQGQCRVGKGPVICYACGETGHMKPVCPMRNVTCYACGVTGHRKRFCPTLTSQMVGSQASVQQPVGTSTQKEEVPKAKGRAFQITPEEAHEDPNVVTDSFVSREFALSFQIACYALAQPFHVDTAGSVSLLVDKVYRDCVIEIEGYNFLANLIPISLPNFDIILGMD